VEAGSNTSTVTLRVVGGDEKESLEFETVKSDPRMTALARGSSNSKRQTRPLVRECPKSTNPQLADANKNLVVSPRRVFYSKTDWPTDRRS
jgi:hypothetical protein